MRLLYCWVANGLNVLVPKRRGAGYLRVPYGHHHNQALTAIANDAGCDVFGLDGSLEFDCRTAYHGGDQTRSEFVHKVMPQLEKYYGMASQEIGQKEFWALHPLYDGERS